jgi:hypothetical protein
MGHPQPATPVEVDNTTAVGFANTKLQQKRSKSMDMRFYWIQDRVSQKQFLVYWRPGDTNLADYFTKHFSPSHHRRTRATYLHGANQISFISSCEGVLIPTRDSLAGLTAGLNMSPEPNNELHRSNRARGSEPSKAH